jgi:hypothetical protein
MVSKFYMRHEVLMAVKICVVVLCIMTLCGLVGWFYIFRVGVSQLWNVACYVEEWERNRPWRIRATHWSWE